jgi:hypothetical protein
VKLQPDLVQAHYFIGLAHLVCAEADASHYEDAARHLGNASRVGPHWQPT